MSSLIYRRGFLAALTGVTAGRAWGRGPQAESLFDGKTLNGWKQEGQATWSVEGGAIIGRQGANGGSGDLFSEKQWQDFELEVEWKMRWPGNSGIWFRYSGPQTAYQADILDQPSHPGVLSGSIYCMGKAFIAENRDASSVNRNGWNRTVITVQGNHFTVEQNGKSIVDLHDSTFSAPGSVGIQAHAGKEFKGMEIRVRKIRIRSL